MLEKLLIQKWSIIRGNELVDIPEEFYIHEDYLQEISEQNFRKAYEEIGSLFSKIYLDQAERPEDYGLPLYKESEWNYFSKEAREVRSAPWKFFYFILYLFAVGERHGNQIDTNLTDVKTQYRYYKNKDARKYLEICEKFGFRVTENQEHISIQYPRNKDVILVLKEVAQKVEHTQLSDVTNCLSNETAYKNGFIGWNYQVLTEDKHTCSIGNNYRYVSDKMHNNADQQVIENLHHLFLDMGYTMKTGDPNEGPSLRYTKKSSTYDYALTSIEGKLFLELRIRKPEKCMDLLKESSEEIIAMFRQTDEGCQNRFNGNCKCGVQYEFENEVKWHCGCCGAPFRIHPVEENITLYLKLMESGRLK